MSLLISCRQEANRTYAHALETSLSKAGKNRSALEDVLDHYLSTGDSLKYHAAVFLISGMQYQYAVTHTAQDTFRSQLYAVQHMTEPIARIYVDSLRKVYGKMQGTQQIIKDLEVISSDFLIHAIDSAFLAWESTAWKDSVRFEDFCNYILPYKNPGAPLQPWRSQYLRTYGELVEDMPDPVSLKRSLDSLLSGSRPRFKYVGGIDLYGEYGASDLLKLNAGECHAWADIATLLLRSQGIPAVKVFTPQWGTYTSGHAWNGYFDAEGNIHHVAIEYNTTYSFTPMNWGFKGAKVYILPYTPNPLSPAMHIDKRSNIPGYLRDPRLLDVTSTCMPVTTIRIARANNRKTNDIPYLCIFGRQELSAIGWGESRNDSLIFADAGRDVVYVPAYYHEGEYIAAADPVVVTFEGEIETLTPDTSRWIETRLYRKFPMKNSMFRYTEPFYGMRVQVSKDKNFSNAVEADTILRYPSPVITDWARQRDRWRWVEYYDSITFDPPLSAQYLRFLAAPRKECIVGEIECYDVQGKKISATAFGSKEGAANVTDGVYGETYHDPDPMGWIALDFGKPVSITKVRYLPSHDSNSIQVGERYALFYWDDAWNKIDEQVAKSKWLDMRVPKKGLLYLRNLDTGKEERPFTMTEQGEQVWW
jgi:hypothetical protein